MIGLAYMKPSLRRGANINTEYIVSLFDIARNGCIHINPLSTNTNYISKCH